MANYSKTTNFASKDSLASGNPLKIVKGTEIDDEFEALETSIATKADSANPAFTGTPTAPTAAAATNNTQVATTAFVKTVISSGGYVATAGIADNAITLAKMADDSVGAAELVDNSVGSDALNVSGTGTAGQALLSDGDGTMSWGDVSNGKVLQVVNASPTTAYSTTSTSFVNSYSASITPSSTSSKILVIAMFMNHSDDNGRIRLARGSTGITGEMQRAQNLGSADNSQYSGLTYLDSPATTSATTYYIQHRNTGGNTSYIGRGFSGFTTPSFITLMEIGA